MSKPSESSVLPLVGFSLVLLAMGGLSLLFFYMVAGKKTEPANLWIGNWTTPESSYTFVLPDGEDFFLTLGILGLKPMSHFHDMNGSVSLYQGDELVWSMRLHESDFQQTRWLELDGGPGAGYVINTLALDRTVSLVPGAEYRLDVSAPAEQIINGSQLWWHYSRFIAGP